MQDRNHLFDVSNVDIKIAWINPKLAGTLQHFEAYFLTE